MSELNWSFVFTIINLLVLYWLLRRYLFRPIMNIMDKRDQLIREQMDTAKKTEEKAFELKKQYELSLANVAQEADLMLNSTRSRAQAEYEVILQNADADAKRVMRETEKAIKTEWEKTMQTISAEVAGLAVSVAEKAVGQQQTGIFDQDLMKAFLEEEGVCNEQNSR